MKKYKYSEIFGNTTQGEGKYSGIPTVWLRFFGCNLQCAGFGQKYPNKPSSWVIKKIDFSKIKKIEDSPIITRGCDTKYSWSKEFNHLIHNKTVEEISKELTNYLRNDFNPEGSFVHKKSGQQTHLAFTGGEPMLQQSAIVEIMQKFQIQNNLPSMLTIETNGTQPPREKFKSYFMDGFSEFFRNGGKELFWSVSPKLSASGESRDKTIHPEVLAEYYRISDQGQLKYVVDGTQKCWDEVHEVTKLYKDAGIHWPIWIMPVGSTAEQQQEIQAQICEQTVQRGYNFSARIHCWIFSNAIGK